MEVESHDNVAGAEHLHVAHCCCALGQSQLIQSLWASPDFVATRPSQGTRSKLVGQKRQEVTLSPPQHSVLEPHLDGVVQLAADELALIYTALCISQAGLKALQLGLQQVQASGSKQHPVCINPWCDLEGSADVNALLAAADGRQSSNLGNRAGWGYQDVRLQAPGPGQSLPAWPEQLLVHPSAARPRAGPLQFSSPAAP